MEEALANAPTAGTGIGQNGITKNDKGENADGSHEQCKSKIQDTFFPFLCVYAFFSFSFFQ